MLAAKKVLIIEASKKGHDKTVDGFAKGAMEALEKVGVGYKRFVVPSITEIPLVIKYATRAMEMRVTEDYYAGYIVLGHEIRKYTGTPESAPAKVSVALQGIQDIAMQLSLAVGNGIVFASEQEIKNCSQEDEKNAGYIAANTCLHMIKVKTELGL